MRPEFVFLAMGWHTGTYCLGIYGQGGSNTVLGANAMMGYDVIFDLGPVRDGVAPYSDNPGMAPRVGFAPSRCVVSEETDPNAPPSTTPQPQATSTPAAGTDAIPSSSPSPAAPTPSAAATVSSSPTASPPLSSPLLSPPLLTDSVAGGAAVVDEDELKKVAIYGGLVASLIVSLTCLACGAIVCFCCGSGCDIRFGRAHFQLTPKRGYSTMDASHGEADNVELVARPSDAAIQAALTARTAKATTRTNTAAASSGSTGSAPRSNLRIAAATQNGSAPATGTGAAPVSGSNASIHVVPAQALVDAAFHGTPQVTGQAGDDEDGLDAAYLSARQAADALRKAKSPVAEAVQIDVKP
jgi:hypothetical protein